MLTEAAQDVFALIGFLSVAACVLVIIFALAEDFWYRNRRRPYNWQWESEGDFDADHSYRERVGRRAA